MGDLQAEITALKAKNQEQEKLIAGLQGENRILAENNKEISAKLDLAMVQAGAGKKALKSSINEPKNESGTRLSRWQHLVAIFTGK